MTGHLAQFKHHSWQLDGSITLAVPFSKGQTFRDRSNVFRFLLGRSSHLSSEGLTMTRYEVFQACHEPDELYSAWLSARLAEWASLSGRTDELKSERRSGWHFPVLVTEAHHAAFDRYLQDWLPSMAKPKDQS